MNIHLENRLPGMKGLIGLAVVAVCLGSLMACASSVPRNTGSISPSSHNPFVDVRDFGAVGDGVTDDTAALQAAVDSLYSNNQGGGTVYFPPGRYRIVGTSSGDTFQGRPMKNGIFLKNVNSSGTSPTHRGENNRVTLRGAGKSSVLFGDSENLVILRISTSFVTVADLVIEGYATYGDMDSGLIGIGMVPENMQDTQTVSRLLYNDLENIYISNTQEGILVMCGPGNSSCYRNSFSSITLYHMVRGIYLASGVKGSPSVNRNHFQNILMNFMNVGFHIESGDTNTCVHCVINNITLAEKPYQGKTPRETPTALVIEKSDKWNYRTNQANRFYNLPFEGNRRNIENRNSKSEFYGTHAAGKNHKSLWEVPPRILTGTWGVYLQDPGLHIGNTTLVPDPSAVLAVESRTQGFLPPRMSQDDRDEIDSPAQGLMIFNTTTRQMNFFDGSQWQALPTQSE